MHFHTFTASASMQTIHILGHQSHITMSILKIRQDVMGFVWQSCGHLGPSKETSSPISLPKVVVLNKLDEIRVLVDIEWADNLYSARKLPLVRDSRECPNPLKFQLLLAPRSIEKAAKTCPNFS
jgi:hypothetical protein